jgi:hypothetical protein
MKIACTIIVLLLLLVGCTKDRTFAPPMETPPAGGANNIVRGTLTVNEFMAKGSAFENEFDPFPGDNDWLELYNTTADTIRLREGEWFLTDDITDSTMFELPDTVILPNGYLIVHCDELDTIATQIHSNFKLSSSGDHIGLFFFTDSSAIAVDNYEYSAQTPGVSMARFPDGSVNWIFSTAPSPNSQNQE